MKTHGGIDNNSQNFPSNTMDNRLLLLSSSDNVIVVRKTILAGETMLVDGIEMHLDKEIGIGHKIAIRPIKTGEKIIKYGVPIGSAICDIYSGAHVHLHNIKSDYTATYSLDDARSKYQQNIQEKI